MTDNSAKLIDLRVAAAQERKSKRSAAPTTSGDAIEPLGDPFAKLPAPRLPRGLLPPVIEAFAEREATTKGVAPNERDVDDRQVKADIALPLQLDA